MKPKLTKSQTEFIKSLDVSYLNFFLRGKDDDGFVEFMELSDLGIVTVEPKNKHGHNGFALTYQGLALKELLHQEQAKGLKKK